MLESCSSRSSPEKRTFRDVQFIALSPTLQATCTWQLGRLAAADYCRVARARNFEEVPGQLVVGRLIRLQQHEALRQPIGSRVSLELARIVLHLQAVLQDIAGLGGLVLEGLFSLQNVE
jgi:hypothetical protein